MSAVLLKDGRRLAYEAMGDSLGYPVVVLHGTPGSSRQLAGLDQAARDRGIAMLAPDRAGYGGSSYERGRTIGSSARDLREFLQHLGISDCAVVGVSGGGPTALACGVVAPDRVKAIATVGSPGPIAPRDPSLPADQVMIRIARRSEPAARLLFLLMVRLGRARPEKMLDRFASVLAESDARLLREPGTVREGFLLDIKHPSPTTAAAAARDFRLFSRIWDVDLAEATVPIQVWHGTEDRNVPVVHAGVIAARCPTARLHIVEGEGHMLFGQIDDILASVLPPGA